MPKRFPVRHRRAPSLDPDDPDGSQPADTRRPSRQIRKPRRFEESPPRSSPSATAVRGDSPIPSTSTGVTSHVQDFSGLLSTMQSMQTQISLLAEMSCPPPPASTVTRGRPRRKAAQSPEQGISDCDADSPQEVSHPSRLVRKKRGRGRSEARYTFSGDDDGTDGERPGRRSAQRDPLRAARKKRGRGRSEARSPFSGDDDSPDLDRPARHGARHGMPRRSAKRDGSSRASHSPAVRRRRRSTHGKRRRTRSPSASTSTGEDTSSSSGSETDFEEYDRPSISFGSISGSNVQEKLRKKILANKFIEMSELMPHYKSQPSSDEYTLKSSKDNSPKWYKSRPKHDINIGQWFSAYNIFMAIYVERARTRGTMLKLLRSMLTYAQTIASLRRKNYDWAAYDRHFRSDRETSKESWATIRQDLLMQYKNEAGQSRSYTSSRREQQPFRSSPSKSFGQAGRTGKKQPQSGDGNRVPFGYCFAYHSRDQRCTATPCEYLHVCPNCKGQHPLYRPCPKNPQSNGTGKAQPHPNFPRPAQSK